MRVSYPMSKSWIDVGKIWCTLCKSSLCFDWLTGCRFDLALFSASEQSHCAQPEKGSSILIANAGLRLEYFIEFVNYPSKHMPDPIRILAGSVWKRWPEAGRMILAHWLTSGPDPFGHNLAQSTRTKSAPGWFCIILSRTSVEECIWVWKWETGSGPVDSCQKPGPVMPAHQLAFRPDECSQTLARPSRSDPGRFCIVWPMPSLEKQIWKGYGKSDLAYTIRPDYGCTLAVTKTLPGRIRHVYWDPFRERYLTLASFT